MGRSGPEPAGRADPLSCTCGAPTSQMGSELLEEKPFEVRWTVPQDAMGELVITAMGHP